MFVVLSQTLGVIQIDEAVWKGLSENEKAETEAVCEEKLKKYFQRFEK